MAICDLSERETAALLDRFNAEHAVAIAARKDNAGRKLSAVSRQGAEEDIDGLAFASSGIRLMDPQTTVLDAENGVRRQDINVVYFDGHAVCGDVHCKLSAARHDLVQHAFPFGTEMRDDNEA